MLKSRFSFLSFFFFLTQYKLLCIVWMTQIESPDHISSCFWGSENHSQVRKEKKSYKFKVWELLDYNLICNPR